jgi:P-type Ca2+ transporter type 2C
MNHMTVTKLWHADCQGPVEATNMLASSSPDSATRTIIRIGNIANNARLSHDHSSSPATASALLSSTLNENASSTVGRSRWVGQPTDVAVLDLLDAFGGDDVRERLGPRTAETPFSSERKWMGVVIGGTPLSDNSSNSRNSPEMAYIKGAIEQVLKRCDTYLSKDGREIVLDEPMRQRAIVAAETMAREGLRVLGFASGQSARSALSAKGSRTSTPRTSTFTKPTAPDEDVYQGLVFAGLVGMNDPPRQGVNKSIRRLMNGGVKVIMITGDAETTAVAIAKKLGMPVAAPHAHTVSSNAVSPVLTGAQIDQMTDAELAQALTSTNIFARTSPEHKMKIIRALQSRGDVVAMTGDGVNDAPALKMADIGVSMGLLGTDVAKEAADMILTDDNFSTILKAIEEGKGIFYNIQNFLTFQLSTSFAALSLVMLSTVLGLSSPLNAMQILWISK